MAKAWFYNIPTHGHINPTLPLVRELVLQGDDVTYFAGPRFAEKIRATGAAYGDYGDAYAFEQSRTDAHAVLQGSQLAEAGLLTQLAARLDARVSWIECARHDQILGVDLIALRFTSTNDRHDAPRLAVVIRPVNRAVEQTPALIHVVAHP